LLIEELIMQRISLDRSNFLAQMQQRLSDLNQGTDALDRQVAELRDLAASQYQQWTSAATRRPRRWRGWLMAASAALLLIFAAGGVGYYFARDWGAVAVIERAEGSTSRIRDGRTETVAAFDRVLVGDRLRTLGDGHLVVRYHDGSLVDVAADSLVEFQTDPANSGKRVFVEQGGMAANVVKQPPRQRMTIGTLVAEANVLGTRLLVSADARQTRLDVFEGVVELLRTSDQSRETVHAQNFAVASAEELRVDRIEWPSDKRGLVFLYGGGYQPDKVIDPLTGQAVDCRLTGRKLALPNHDFALELTGGAYIASDEIAATVLGGCRNSGELTFEAIVQTGAVRQDAGRRIVVFGSDAYDYNFALVQDGSELVFNLKTTPQGGKPLHRQITLCRLEDTSPHHLAVAYRDGQTVCYLDGAKVFESAALTGSLRDWSPQHLVLGDQWQGGRDWSGMLEGVAIYNRFLSHNDARRHAEYYHQLISLREPVPQIEVEVELVERSAAPAVAQLAPGQSQLVVSKYRVREVLRGELEAREILVIDCTVLNGEPLPAGTAKPGDRARLLLEHVEHNPQIPHIAREVANDFEAAHYYAVRREPPSR
jgi:ferric-dicitrate binding protein FerR (iron transport regulator)